MPEEIKLYTKRWLVAGIVVFVGYQIGFTSVFLGVLGPTLAEYFHLEAVVVDWFTTGFSAGVVMGVIPFGLYAALYPMKLKPLLIVSLTFPIAGYALIFFSMLFRKYPGLIVFAQLTNGVIGNTFLPVAGLASTTWFDEREQGTVYGLAWSSFGVGSLFASIISSIILGSMKDNIVDVVKSAAYVYIATIVAYISVLLAVLILIPKHPVRAPSFVEFRRRSNLSFVPLQETWKDQFRKFGMELKKLFTKRAAATLLVISSLAFSTNVSLLLLMPPVEVTSLRNNLTNETTSKEELNARKAFTLIWFTVGTIVGGILIGIALDKTKSYHPLATILSLFSVASSLVMLLAYLFSMQNLMIGFTFVFGVTLMGTQAFSGEVLKQYAFQFISIATHGMAITLFANIFQMLSALLGRAVIEALSNKYFFVYNLTCSLLMSILLISINPPQNRYLEEERALLTTFETVSQTPNHKSNGSNTVE